MPESKLQGYKFCLNVFFFSFLLRLSFVSPGHMRLRTTLSANWKHLISNIALGFYIQHVRQCDTHTRAHTEGRTKAFPVFAFCSFVLRIIPFLLFLFSGHLQAFFASKHTRTHWIAAGRPSVPVCEHRCGCVCFVYIYSTFHPTVEGFLLILRLALTHTLSRTHMQTNTHTHGSERVLHLITLMVTAALCFNPGCVCVYEFKS